MPSKPTKMLCSMSCWLQRLLDGDDLGICFQQYQEKTREFATYPELGNNIIYPAMGLAGEAGEALDKVKKFWRNHNITAGYQLDPEQRVALAKEIGDVLWYAANLASELDYDLAVIAQMNLEKLADRRERGVIKSEGDNR